MAGIDGKPNPWAGDASSKAFPGAGLAADAMAVSARARVPRGRNWPPAVGKIAKATGEDLASDGAAGWEGGTALA